MPVKKGGLDNVIVASKGNTKQKHGISSTRRGIQLDEIKDRPHGDTRDLRQSHINELADSIEAVGLIQPLAVDSANHLLAGGHRRAALEQLQETNIERFQELFPTGIPVKVFDFDALDDAGRATEIEIIENEKRRDYSKEEALAIADRLRKVGYEDVKGRPKKGQKPLKPALAAIIGKSKRYVQTLLNEGALEAKGGNLPPLSKWEKRAAQLERWAQEAGDKSLTRRATKMAADFRAMEASR